MRRGKAFDERATCGAYKPALLITVRAHSVGRFSLMEINMPAAPRIDMLQ